MRLKSLSVFLAAVLLMLSAGCAKAPAAGKKYNLKTPEASIDSCILAENSELRLSWNDELKFVVLENLRDGKIWSAVPYDYYSSGGTSANVNSSVNITVNNANTMMTETLRGYSEANEGGRVFSKKIDNGVRVVYCFDAYKISVTVDYTLESDHLKATVDPRRIVEGGDFQLVSVSLAPFMCSVSNGQPDSYLFVPAGSGALMYPDERTDGTREYSGEVYGDEAARIMPENILDDEQIYMPVFGAKAGESAILGIISSGAPLASISAEAGNERTGYSTVYPTFSFRGYDAYPTKLWVFNRQDIKQASSVKASSAAVVNYYPLSGGDSDYIGMAERYRRYLTENKKLKAADSSEELYRLEIIGGSLVDTAAGGVPHKRLSVMTSFSEAAEIIKDAADATGLNPSVELRGFGKNGLNFGEIADGFKFGSKFGKSSELFEFCNSEKIPVYVNYDLMRFSKSGSGFSYLGDSARSASLHIAELYNINTPLRDYDKSSAYRFLSREKLKTAAEKLAAAAGKQDIKNISLDSLGYIAYSDFSDIKYAVKGNIDKDVSEIISSLQKSGYGVSVCGANDYAAAASDKIYSVPLDNGDYFAFDCSVPFYQAVFLGSKSIYSGAVNTAENYRKAVMQAVSTGVRPSYSVAFDCDILTSSSSNYRIYGTKWSDICLDIYEDIKTYSDFYLNISGCGISDYQLLGSCITKTVFENGTEVYANHSAAAADSDVGEIEGYGLRIIIER